VAVCHVLSPFLYVHLFSALTLLAGRQAGHGARKKRVGMFVVVIECIFPCLRALVVITASSGCAGKWSIFNVVCCSHTISTTTTTMVPVYVSLSVAIFLSVPNYQKLDVTYAKS